MKTRTLFLSLGAAILSIAAVTAVWSQQTGVQQDRIVQPQAELGGTLMVVVSAENDMAWGYSKQTGLWHPLELVTRVREPAKVFAGECVAIVQAGSYVYGFSADMGQWDTIRLDQPAMAAPVVMKDWGTVSTIGRIHAFSGQTGKWATLDVRAEVLRRGAPRR